MRLDKFIASQGKYSRAEVKALIKNGRIAVNGAAVSPDTDIGAGDSVLLDGADFSYKKHVYIMMNKPAGVLSASRDTSKTVIDLIPENLKRPGLFPAGRLDKDTTGLLIITDDGGFAHRLLSPASRIEKNYRAVVDSEITREHIELFGGGITLLNGEKCLPARLEILKDGKTPLVSVTVFEGKYHQVKRMLKMIGAGVVSLERVRIGGVELDPSLPHGECREMSRIEQENISKNSFSN